MAFPPAFTRAWDETFPPDTQQANQLGLDIRQFKQDIRERHALLSGTFANRPTNMDAVFGGAGYGTLYFSTDTGVVYQWNGAAWLDITSSVSRNPPVYAAPNITPNPLGPRPKLTTVAAGHNDFYTVPANRRALFTSAICGNQTGAVVTFWFETNIGGTYYRLSSTNTSTINNNTWTNFSPNQPYIADAGDKLGINVNQTGTFVLQASILEYDNTGALKCIRLTTFSAGNNTLYTVPVGKSAYLFPFVSFGVGSISQTLAYNNDSGGSRTAISYCVPNGGAAGAGNQLIAPAGTGNGSGVQLGNSGTTILAAQDFIVINVDAGTATQIAWGTVAEF